MIVAVKKLVVLFVSLAVIFFGLLTTLVVIKAQAHAKPPVPAIKLKTELHQPDPKSEFKPNPKADPLPEPKPNSKPPTIPKLDIRLTQKGFKTDPENFMVVCNSAAMAIARHYPKYPFKPILIPKADNRFPVMLDQRGPKGESQIMLSIGDGWGWAQIAFQFSHEFTHIIINQNQPGAGPNHWINEAFCEAASYHAIKIMAEEWKTHPPYPNWKGYAKHLNSYAKNYLGKERAQPEGMNFIPWLKKNEHALRLGKRYPNREIYKYVSYQFYQLIEKDPKHLGSLGYLNAGLKNSGLSTQQYLTHWKMVLPDVYKPFADQVAGIFGYRLR